MKNKLLLIFLPFLFVSCQPIMMKIYGIKKPDIENKKTILKKAEKYGLESSNIVTVNENNFLRTLSGQSIPDGAIYNKDGKYIEYRQSDTSCNAGLFQFIPELSLQNKYNVIDSLVLDNELIKYRDLEGNKIAKIEPADFYILIYWTVWTGKLNKDHVKVWEDLANENKNCNIKVIKVNLDIQEYWSEKEREKIIRAMSKKNKT